MDKSLLDAIQRELASGTPINVLALKFGQQIYSILGVAPGGAVTPHISRQSTTRVSNPANFIPGPQGPPGDPALATTDASELTSGILPDARLSDTALGVLIENADLVIQAGTSVVAPTETIISGRDAVHDDENFDDRGGAIVIQSGRPPTYGGSPQWGLIVFRTVDDTGELVGEITWDGGILQFPIDEHTAVAIGTQVKLQSPHTRYYYVGDSFISPRFSARQVCTPFELTIIANQDNYNPVVSGNYRLITSAPRTITGWRAPVNGSGSSQDGTVMYATNVSSSAITFSHLSGSSDSTQQFHTNTGADIVLGQNETLRFEYIGTPLVKWKISKL